MTYRSDVLYWNAIHIVVFLDYFCFFFSKNVDVISYNFLYTFATCLTVLHYVQCIINCKEFHKRFFH